MSDGLEVCGDSAPRSDGDDAPSLHEVDTPAPGPVPSDARHAVHDGCGGIVPILAKPNSDAPAYRRSLFRR